MSAALHLLPDTYNVTLFASAARALQQAYTSATQFNHQARGMLVFVDVTAETATASVTPSVQVSFDDGATWVTFWTAAAAIEATGDFLYMIYPILDASADGAATESVALPLPRCWRWVMTHADTDALTYSVTAQLL